MIIAKTLFTVYVYMLNPDGSAVPDPIRMDPELQFTTLRACNRWLNEFGRGQARWKLDRPRLRGYWVHIPNGAVGHVRYAWCSQFP